MSRTRSPNLRKESSFTAPKDDPALDWRAERHA